jgi:uncharacterized membrane protein YcaP (DUF421 family)
MELDRIAIRALLVYVILLGLIRVSGKRTLAQATPFDFVLTLVLGDLIDDALWAEVPLSRFVAAVATLTITHLLVAWASSRSERLDRLIEGAATPVMDDGKPLRAGLRRERMSDGELAYEARHAGIDREDWPEVRTAHVECSGALSVLRHEWARPVQKKDAEAMRGARHGGREKGTAPER